MSGYIGKVTTHFPTAHEPLRNASSGTKAKKMVIAFGVSLLLGGIVVGLGFWLDLGWLKITGYSLTGIILFVNLFSSANTKISSCVYCQGDIGKTLDDSIEMDDQHQKVECPHCYQWLISHEGVLRAFTPEDVRDEKHFDLPVCETTSWQNECVVCGGEVAKREKARHAKVNLEHLLIGTLSVSSASINNVPYCENHSNKIPLKINDDYLFLRFPDFEMRKRYLDFNKGNMNKKVKVKSDWQKLISKQS
jgi:hypothetical protein